MRGRGGGEASGNQGKSIPTPFYLALDWPEEVTPCVTFLAPSAVGETYEPDFVPIRRLFTQSPTKKQPTERFTNEQTMSLISDERSYTTDQRQKSVI